MSLDELMDLLDMPPPIPQKKYRYYVSRPTCDARRQAKRTCLACSKAFKSQGPANRRCPKCAQALSRTKRYGHTDTLGGERMDGNYLYT